MAAVTPVPFIQVRKGKLEVCAEGAAVLRAVKDKIAVVVVAGPYRTGKSFILNRLISGGDRTAEGFAVGSTVKACTKGIWVWGGPVRERGTTYIFLDTEGLGSTESDATYDIQIFSLAVLLSSLFVLNTQGTLNEGAIEQLQLVVELTKRIRVREEGRSSADEFAEFAPHFLWVLRDFALQLENDENGRPMTARQYLEQALTAQQGSKKNSVRAAVTAVFKSRDCITMVRPTTEERDLQKLSTLSFDRMRPEFQQQFTELRQRVFTTARPKRYNGATLTGTGLVELAREYVKALNDGAVPAIHSAWESVVAVQAQAAREAARQAYEAEVSKFDREQGPMEEDALRALHEAGMAKAQQAVVANAMGDETQVRELIDSLSAEFIGRLNARRETNRLRSAVNAPEIASRLWTQHVAGKETKPEFGQALTRFLKAYEDTPLGPEKGKALAKLFVEKWGEYRQATDQRYQTVQDELLRAREELTRARKDGQDELKRLQASAAKADADAKSAGEAARAAQQELRRSSDVQTAASKSNEKELKKVQAEVDRLTRAIAEKDEAIAALNAEKRAGDKDKSARDASTRAAETRTAQAESRLADSQAELAGARAEIAHLRQELAAAKSLAADAATAATLAASAAAAAASPAAAPPKGKGKAAGSKRTFEEMDTVLNDDDVAPGPVSAAASTVGDDDDDQEPYDPNTKNVQFLKSRLTKLDKHDELPNSSKAAKQTYIDLALTHDPKAIGYTGGAGAKKAKKAKK